MTIQLYDFSRPPSLHPDSRAKLAVWLNRTNSWLKETLAGMQCQVEVTLDDCATAWPTKSLAEWSEKTVAFRIKLANLAELSVIAIPNPLAQIMAAALMGEQAARLPEERDLTSAEQSVIEFFATTIVNGLIETWLSDDRLNLRVFEREPNLRRTKMFKAKEPFVICRSLVKTPVGDAPLIWMMPHEFLTELFGAIRKEETTTKATSRQQLELLAREMRSQVTIRLGTVQLSAPQVTELRVGDLVVLNQKTSEPLKAFISGKPKYLGWPGRVGHRQAFEIATEGTRIDPNQKKTA